MKTIAYKVTVPDDHPLAEAWKKPPVEAVIHPQHYGGDTVYEAIKVIHAWGLGFCLGNAAKYICRAGKKDDTKTIEDLKKARFYLDWEIKRLEQANNEKR